MTVPARAWLAAYDRTWLRGDVVAGITLAAYLLPSAIGDSSLAGLPPQAGLYACLFGGLVFWIILVAVTGLVQIETMRHIWRFSRTEFAVVVAALLGVLGSGLLNEAFRRAHSTVAKLAEANQTVDAVVNKWRLTLSMVA